jgi:hypothetical protein
MRRSSSSIVMPRILTSLALVAILATFIIGSALAERGPVIPPPWDTTPTSMTVAQ